MNSLPTNPVRAIALAVSVLFCSGIHASDKIDPRVRALMAKQASGGFCSL
jgi:hypothetical protein